MKTMLSYSMTVERMVRHHFFFTIAGTMHTGGFKYFAALCTSTNAAKSPQMLMWGLEKNCKK